MILLFDTDDFLEALKQASDDREFVQDIDSDILDEPSSYTDTSQKQQ